MNLKIVFLDEATIPGVDFSAIKALGDYTAYDSTLPEQAVERSLGADVVITNKVPLKADTLAQLPGLKLICIAASGMNNIDLEAAKNAGIEVMNAAGYSSHSVAELTIASVLALYRQIIFYDEYVKSGQYAASDAFFNSERPTFELYAKKWGIIGLGHIGKTVAGIATAFGCDVAYYSTSGENKDTDYKSLELDELLSESDIVTVHAPLSRKTYHLLDYHQFSLMKKSGIMVNVARGSLINEDGLARALNDGLIAGAAVDVYSKEPITADNPLNSVKDKYKIITTPHIAWSTKEALQRLIDTIAENISTYIAKKKKADQK